MPLTRIHSKYEAFQYVMFVEIIHHVGLIITYIFKVRRCKISHNKLQYFTINQNKYIKSVGDDCIA